MSASHPFTSVYTITIIKTTSVRYFLYLPSPPYSLTTFFLIIIVVVIVVVANSMFNRIVEKNKAEGVSDCSYVTCSRGLTAPS
mmetsp:Transcript_30369/g.48738  ORF Transcript_30369/g.48738 Transcript_30369/m.48738 type:complete len:83 (-) Transcript_30369:1242-1490(-)